MKCPITCPVPSSKLGSSRSASIEGYFAQGLGIDEAGQQGLRDALTESGWGIRIGLETTTPENVQVTDAHCARVFANVT
jgi:hypothetical protein